MAIMCCPFCRGNGSSAEREPVCDRKAGILCIQGLWLEPEVKMTKALKGPAASMLYPVR